MKIKDAKFIKGIRGTDDILDDKKKHIAFFGRSNAGKSSSINYLLERKSLVKSSSTPGKTREVNFFLVNDKYYFVDLPGYGFAKIGAKNREKLRKMILWYLMESEVKDRLIVVVVDAKAGVTEFDKEILNLVEEEEMEYLILLNKTDRLNQKDLSKVMKKMKEDYGDNFIKFSAVKKRGREEFFKKIFG